MAVKSKFIQIIYILYTGYLYKIFSYPLTLPAVKPLIRYFWNTIKSKTIGMAAIIDKAAKSPHNCFVGDIKDARPTGSV